MSPRKVVSATVETATVAALTHTGEGIVRGGKTVFVAGALPGEAVRFRRTRTHRQHDEAELVEVLTPAAERVKALLRAGKEPHFAEFLRAWEGAA